ncbi:MAG TPA: phosphoribosyltransferase, partial [Candidatus Methanoperedenaceae archaeon]|nr:phosphoribosyltransferase [Candidatus Methanoperedenaceae archaeon]
NDLTSLKIEHYTGTAAATGQPSIKYPLANNAVAGKKVLIVDDITDTGKSIVHAKDYISKQKPVEVRSAVLQYLYTSEVKPDYVGELVEEWAWIVYPWNFMEDMIDIISKLMVKEKRDAWSTPAIRTGLFKFHSIDPISFEIAQPDRLNEVLAEMVRRRILKVTSVNGQEMWKFIGTER